MNQTQKNIPSLTGIRFFAALSVVIAHAMPRAYGSFSDQFLIYLSLLAGLGMPLFFTLSGFVIHYTYAKSLSQQGKEGIKKFAIARFARLYPLYSVCFLLSLLIMTIKGDPIKSLEGILRFLTLTQTWTYRVFDNTSLTHLYGNATISWSISTEVFLYFLYPILLFFFSRFKSIKSYLSLFLSNFILTCVIMYILFVNFPAINEFATLTFGPTADFYFSEKDCFLRWLLYVSPFCWIFSFISGCCAAAIFMSLQEKTILPREQKKGIFFLLISIAYVIIMYLLMFSKNSFCYVHEFIKFFPFGWGLTPALTVIIFCCARYRTPFTRFMEYPLFVKLGEASYSLYLLHPIVFSFIIHLKFVLPFNPLLKFVLIIFSSLIISVFSYRFIEIPARSFLRKKLTKTMAHGQI